jgi:hypothetical protein
MDDYLGQRAGRRAVPRFLGSRLIVGTEQGGVDPVLGVRLPPYAAPAFGDLRGNGAADVIVGSAGGGIFYFSPAAPR